MDKYTSGAFASTKYGIYKSAQDIITSFPATVIADGQSASAVIKGNLQQSGTPTASSPIYPTETGDKTANLLNNNLTDVESSGIRITVNADKSIIINGSFTSGDSKSFDIDTLSFKSGETYTISGVTGYTTSTLQLWTTSSSAFPTGNRLQSYNGAVSRTALATETCTIRLFLYPNITYDNVIVSPMVIKGSDTSAPYEPYGYKIPILSGGTTTPVYLGQVQSTRQIKKLVLTGGDSENWLERAQFDNASAYSFNGLTDKSVDYTVAQAVCSHFTYLASYADQSNHFYQDANNIYFTSTQYRTLTDWKTYLQQQYSAGTPVTVWYVLATPTTGIVNEPIRKIGNYADSVSVSNIPTTSGSASFNVDTTLKPSEVDLTYNGWHMYDDKKYTNGAWG